MRILYGAVGEGLGHATRSRVVAEHLLGRGHRVKMAASGRALPYLREHLPDVEEIWGLAFALEHGRVEAWKTLSLNVRGGLRGVPEDWRRGAEIARAFAPELVVADFDGFSYLFAKAHRLPVLSIDNIQMVDRCRHDAEILHGIHRDYLAARAFVGGKLPRADRYLIATFFRPPLRKKRTVLVPSILRPEILAASPESGSHLLVYGRLGETSTAALRASGVPCRVYGARNGLTADEEEGNLRYRPFANEAFIDDLRTCRGVVASAGFSLMSEVVYLRKPMLALPLAGQFEQEMNARYLERLGYGTAASALDEASLERFLARLPALADALAGYEQDGNAQTFAEVDRAVDEIPVARRG
ncbi:MAG: glycosyltransferase family protein [Gaiellaceae bacterium]